jgi:biotin carboxyl carrier protein
LGEKLHWRVEVERTSASRGSVAVGGKVYSYEVQGSGKNQLTVVVNEQVRQVEYFVERNVVHVFNSAGDQLGFRLETDERKVAEEAVGEGALKSPMPGTVTKVSRKVGDVVKKGESILAMEAMKMELVLKAEYNGRVVKIDVAEGEFVEAGRVLVEI